ncbi:MAG: dicarboxylate/amino acid:cation symporter, partial [Desulfovibrionales bacterium]|nr:dicarboxylate/amino acid:cation symporter [Desulfovibrionales bacterium]
MSRATKNLLGNLGVQILIAMVLGILAGRVMGGNAVMFQPMGDVFISLIKMLVIPLVAVSVTSGAASLGNAKSAGKLGISTFVYYLGTTAVAVTIGLTFGELFHPGTGLDISQVQQWFSQEKAGKAIPPEFWHLILSLIPTNPIKAFTEGNILQTLFFCLFLGIGIGTLAEEKKAFLLKLFNTLTEALIWMIKIVMLVAPLGVFALMASATGTFGYDILALVVKLLVVYIGAILLHGFGFYPLVLKLFSKMPVGKFLSKIYKPQVVALSTASSMATLPMTFETCEQELGVSKETSSFVLPLGATINMDGNAIYYALAAVFFAQIFGIELTMTSYIAIIFTATIGSIGQAGVPGPSLLVVAVLVSAGIPIEGLPLLYAVDRIFDMIRTALNITGDATCAVIVDRFAAKE